MKIPKMSLRTVAEIVAIAGVVLAIGTEYLTFRVDVAHTLAEHKARIAANAEHIETLEDSKIDGLRIDMIRLDEAVRQQSRIGQQLALLQQSVHYQIAGRTEVKNEERPYAY